MTYTFKISAIAAAALAFTFAAPIDAQAGEIGKRALKGAVAGAVVSEITGGDAKDGAKVGAAVGAISGIIHDNDKRDHRTKDRGAKPKVTRR